MRRAALLLLTATFLTLGVKALRADDAPVYDWGVAYFMSYDNNLEKCGKPIMKMIREGTASPKVVCAVQADFSDTGGMHRYVMKGGEQTEEERVKSDDSGSEDEAIAYLEWFVKTYKCKKYVFTFLNHGGRIDQMCVDEDAGTVKQGRWMSGKVLGEKLRAFKSKIPGKLELFFLQQCGRGSMENLYSFRGVAPHVMASPIPVGAPNTYYGAFGKWLGENPNANGLDCAKKIAEQDQHYTIYTCLKGSELDELPKRLDAVIKPFVGAATLEPGTKQKIIHPVGEPIVDAKLYFEALSKANGDLGAKEVEAFFKWSKDELFEMIQFHPTRTGLADQLCGLSIFAPNKAREATRYAKLDLYGKTKLPELWKKLTTPKEEPKPEEKKPEEPKKSEPSDQKKPAGPY